MGTTTKSPTPTPTPTEPAKSNAELLADERAKRGLPSPAPAPAKAKATPAKAKGAKATPAPKGIPVPAPKGADGKNGKKDEPGAGRFAFTIIRANPESVTVGKDLRNPRKPGTHGYRLFEKIREAGAKGIAYETLRAYAKELNAKETKEYEAGKRTRPSVFKGFLNHVTWDYDRKYIVVEKVPPAK